MKPRNQSIVKAQQLLSLILLIISFEACARGSSGLGAIIFVAAVFGFQYIIMMLCFGSIVIYARLIAKLFNVPYETANSGWFPLVCFFGTAFLIIIVGKEL